MKLGTTSEKPLVIDRMCLRQSYERREIAEIRWIDGETNPADAMTKSMPPNHTESKSENSQTKSNMKVFQFSMSSSVYPGIIKRFRNSTMTSMTRLKRMGARFQMSTVKVRCLIDGLIQANPLDPRPVEFWGVFWAGSLTCFGRDLRGQDGRKSSGRKEPKDEILHT